MNLTTCCNDCCYPTDQCLVCIDGSCQLCGGIPNMTCCDDGSCAAPCEEVGSETPCNSENNTSCPACAGISGNCSGSKARYYTNATIYNCSGGCPGPPPDCDYEDPAPNCYDTYFCADHIYYRFAKCTIWRYEPGDIPMDPEPLECYSRDYVWGCTRCQQG